ncbi:hypothetical protein [Chromobacterium alticapitis]|uniref:hypothetical protein n=1 Tax=Chromobacterium alticapitis TaxID=2073169 RepID=UPI00130484DF|nr:hypothetical protein [Chromobacterium alticapitis]
MTDHSPHALLLGLNNQDDCAAAPLASLLGQPPLVPPEQVSRLRVMVTPEYLERLRGLARVLDTALRAIVAQYFRDERIRAVYGLPPELESILQRASGQRYNPGFYRPDFVYDRDGQPRICEIGARYPLNGWMISHLLDKISAEPTERQPGYDAFLDALRELHPSGSTSVIVHAREPGTEIFLLADELRRSGARFLQAHPFELRCSGGQLRVRDQTVDQAILEMDRSELSLLPPAVLTRLIETGAYFNDVRTLILVHDKRVLAVLNQVSIMRDYLPAADYAVLQPFLIPTHIVSSQPEAEALLQRPERLIAKLSSGGRGLGARVRHACGEEEWRRLVLRQWSRYMFQDYIEQREFLDPASQRRIRLVGMQLCRNGTSYGPGVFRGSDELVINVHQRRGKLYSTMVAA